MGITRFPHGVFATPNIGADIISIFSTDNIWFVDGDVSGSGDGSIDAPIKTIQAAVTAAAAVNNGDGGIIYVKALDMPVGSTDPVSYAETVIIPATAAKTMIIGVGNRTQGGLPQIRIGSGSTALITVRAPGCLIANLGFNGYGSTGGGILLDDDSSTKTAFGTTIANCHIKNCAGITATNAATGGGIQWSSAGGAWQVRIVDNVFYKNVGDIVLKGTGISVPQDVIIEENVFQSASTSATDCNLYLMAGTGMSGLMIRNNVFGAVPALAAGTNAKYLALTGCYGVLVNNSFGSNGRTFGAAGNELVPATMFLANNYQEKSTSGSGEIFRT